MLCFPTWVFTIHFRLLHLAYYTLTPLTLEERTNCFSVSLCPAAGWVAGPRVDPFSEGTEAGLLVAPGWVLLR